MSRVERDETIAGHEWDYLARLAFEETDHIRPWAEIACTRSGDRMRNMARAVAKALGFTSAADLGASNAHALRALRGEAPVFSDVVPHLLEAGDE